MSGAKAAVVMHTPLTQEARYGRIRALRKLGKRAEERAAIESFLAAHPKSVQAAILRKEAH